MSLLGVFHNGRRSTSSSAADSGSVPLGRWSEAESRSGHKRCTVRFSRAVSCARGRRPVARETLPVYRAIARRPTSSVPGCLLSRLSRGWLCTARSRPTREVYLELFAWHPLAPALQFASQPDYNCHLPTPCPSVKGLELPPLAFREL